MNPLNQLLVFVLVVVVGLLAYVYFHYIKSGDPLPKEDKDWKKTKREELDPKIDADKKWADEKIAEGKVRAYETDQILCKFFKQLWNDGIFQWGAVKAFFEYIGEIIWWNKYRWWYVGALLIIIGLVCHYIFGI